MEVSAYTGYTASGLPATVTTAPVTPTPNSIPATSNLSFSDTLMKMVTDKLMDTSGMLSSANTQFESAIGNAISGVKDLNTAADQRTTNTYDRMIGIQQTRDQNNLTAIQERGVGVSTTDVAYRALAQEADNNIKDLQQRKEDALLANDTASAKQLSDLQVQLYQTKVSALKDSFTQLLSLGNFGLQTKQEERMAAQQTFNEKQAIASIGLQYGITPTANDTMDTIAAKVGAVAGTEEALKIKQMQANINKANAEAASALRSGNIDLSNTAQVEGLINLAVSDPRGFSTMIMQLGASGKTQQAAQMGEIANRAGQKQLNQIPDTVKQLVDKGYTLQETLDEVAGSQTWLNADAMVTKVTEAYNSTPKTKSNGFLEGFLSKFNGTGSNNNAQPGTINTKVTSPGVFDANALFSSYSSAINGTLK